MKARNDSAPRMRQPYRGPVRAVISYDPGNVYALVSARCALHMYAEVCRSSISRHSSLAYYVYEGEGILSDDMHENDYARGSILPHRVVLSGSPSLFPFRLSFGLLYARL